MAYVIENTSREGRVLLYEPKCSVALFIENSWWLTYASWSWLTEEWDSENCDYDNFRVLYEEMAIK